MDEIITISPELFNLRMDGLENLLFGNFMLLCLCFGALLALLVLRWFHVR